MPSAGDLACWALTEMSKLKYCYASLAEGSVGAAERHLGRVSVEVHAEAVDMVKSGLERLANKRAKR